LISERPENWNYGVIKTLQSRLCPLLDALKTLREEGLTAALFSRRSTIDGNSR
jgi:hypothetical protein